MTVKKLKRQQFLIKNHHRIDGKFSRQRCLDPDPDPVCHERLDPDPVCLEGLDAVLGVEVLGVEGRRMCRV